MAAFMDDGIQHVEEDDGKPVSTEDGVCTTSRETTQNKVNGIRNSRSKHSHLSHSTRDPGYLGQDGEGKPHERERHRRSSSSSLVCSGSKGSKASKTKYFIIKSLNHHNIEKSVENGIWATQAMNEPILNEAFETADRVLLVFSVNMSGHFQGYAQMTSPIGRRRANVWSEANEGANPWGGSFSVDWLSLYDLPFQKTVHLKNPLNFFKPVKISRDCQELAEEVGQALCGLIDEGADREGRPKRKVTVADLTEMSLKRRRKELPELPDGSQSRQQSSARRNDSTSFSDAHASHIPQGAKHNRLSPFPVSRLSRVLSSGDSPYPLEPQGGSKSKSPHPASSERSWDREQDNERERSRRPRRPLERNVVRDRTRSRSSGRSADFPVEEDLLNMTYEDYLQRHGHSREFNNGYPQGPGRFFPNSLSPGYGGGWRGTNAGMGFAEDQYSDYVTNWYTRQQGPPMGRDAFFEPGGVGNNCPMNRPPDAH